MRFKTGRAGVHPGVSEGFGAYRGGVVSYNSRSRRHAPEIHHRKE